VAVSLPEVVQEHRELSKERYGVEPELVRASQSTARSLTSSSLKQHRLRPESIAGTTRLKPANTSVAQVKTSVNNVISRGGNMDRLST